MFGKDSHGAFQEGGKSAFDEEVCSSELRVVECIDVGKDYTDM